MNAAVPIVFLVRWCAHGAAGFHRDAAIVQRHAARWHKLLARSHEKRADAILKHGEKAVELVLALYSAASPEK